MDYLKRFEATEATKTRFQDQDLDWGKIDCLQMAAFCLKAMRGDRPLKGVRKYTSRLGAIRTLKTSGYNDLADAVDAYGLDRIAPAMALPGDIIGLPAVGDVHDGFGDYALAIMIAADAVLAFADLEDPVTGRVSKRAIIGPLNFLLEHLPALAGKPVLAWRSI